MAAVSGSSIWTPPALQARLRFCMQDRTADNISGLVVRPSTRALKTFARRRLATLAVSQPPSALSGWFHDGLTYFHQCLCAGNPGGCSPFALLSISGPPPPSGGDGRRPSWAIFGVMGQDRPGDPRVLGCNCDRSDIHVPALSQASRPCALGIGFSVYTSQVRTGSVYEQCSYVRVACLVICPRRFVPPLEYWRGVRPSEAA